MTKCSWIQRTSGLRTLVPEDCCLNGLDHIISSHRSTQWHFSCGFPDASRIHGVFHVSLLRPYQSDGPGQPLPPSLLIEDEAECGVSEVDRISHHRGRPLHKRQTRQYLVKWLGYGAEHNTREPEQNLQSCQQSLHMYWKSVADRQGVHETVSWGRDR